VYTLYCDAKAVNVFEKLAVTDPSCIARQKSQTALSVFLKYLPAWRYIGHYLMLMGIFVSRKYLAAMALYRGFSMLKY
jgi:hypothetical protein